MDSLIDKLSIYMIPPFLSLVIGFSLGLLSIVKGKFRKENILFSLVCFWWTCLLSPAFIAHHLFKGDEALILFIERVIHFYYVYMPFVLLAYMNEVLKLQKKQLVWIAAAVSFLISLFTQSEYYFTGLYSYSWGYIAKGGILFNIFGLYGMIVTAYIAFEGFKRLRTETNYIMKIKIKYIFLSLLASAIMTFCNIPAINGIDFYPIGNLSFIPLAILAYGVLRFRLMDIRSIIHITIVWILVSSLVIIPNIFLLAYFWPKIVLFQVNKLIIVAIFWFMVNYIYMWKVQPFIDQLCNRRKFNLNAIESQFIENIAHLKSYEELLGEFTGALGKTLSFTDFDAVKRDEVSGTYKLKNGESVIIGKEIESWLLENNDLVNKSLVETDPIYSPVRDAFLPIFARMKCEFMLPIISDEQIIGILAMPERKNLQQLSTDEIRFIVNLRNAVITALLNSLMYRDLVNYKNNLERMVEERTIELKKSHRKIEEAMKTISELAIRDELTGLFNRRHLMAKLEDEKNRAFRNESPFCLVILDIDHFKKVNDVYGHLAGDTVLKVVATTIQMMMRNTDFCGRYGGEEFLLVYPQTNIPGAVICAERLRTQVEDLRIPEIDDDFRVTVSLGLTEYCSSDEISEMIARADSALYRAKDNGRNRLELST